MRNKIIFPILVISLLFISACVQTVEETPEKKPTEVDVVSKNPTEAKEEVKETKEVSEIPPEIKELLETSNTKVESLRYSYKGPETKDFFYDFVVKGNNVKYLPIPDYKTIDVDDDAYDTIYLDNELKTAQAYCDDRKCKVKGKKADLDYDEAHILTPLEWLSKIESAEKVGEELIEGKYKTWKLSTNSGTMWIDSFYGVPLQIESDANLYKFVQRVEGEVKDEEVIPQD